MAYDTYKIAVYYFNNMGSVITLTEINTGLKNISTHTNVNGLTRKHYLFLPLPFVFNLQIALITFIPTQKEVHYVLQQKLNFLIQNKIHKASTILKSRIWLQKICHASCSWIMKKGFLYFVLVQELCMTLWSLFVFGST